MKNTIKRQRQKDKRAPEPSVDLDEKYWREAVLSKPYYRAQIGFDRYRWALRYGLLAHQRHGGKGRNVETGDIIRELMAGWEKFGKPSGLTWDEAREAVIDSWSHADSLIADSIANHGGFDSPPTFTEQGCLVPRNLDEPNA
jgi:hypothetical protein